MHRTHEDHTSLIGHERVERRLGEHDPPDDIGVEHGEKFVFGQLCQGPPVHVARVVDQGVEMAAAMFERRCDHGGAVGRDRDVTDHRSTGGSDGLGDRCDLVRTTTRDRDAGPRRTQMSGDPFTEPGSTAGDEDRHVLDAAHHTSSRTQASARSSSAR